MKIVRSLEAPAKKEMMFSYFEEIISSGNYAEGHQTTEAEKLLSYVTHCKGLLLNSCGSALFAAYSYYKQYGITHAVMQNNTFYATGQMALEAGITPVLCDNASYCPSMGAKSMMEAVRKSGAKLVVLTHVGGWLAKDYQEIAKFCKENHICLMEDCAHAFGVEGAGSLGETACWSFYPTKAVPIGEGGAVTSHNDSLLEFVRKFRSYGKFKLPPDPTIFYQRGMNLRISEWDAAILRVQIQFLSEILRKRREDARKLQSIAECLLDGESNYYKYPVLKSQAEGYKKVGKVYAHTDQLECCLGDAITPVSLKNSWEWADTHECLPIGEGLYEGVEDIKEYLRA